jgi:hypothetical protein
MTAGNRGLPARKTMIAISLVASAVLLVAAALLSYLFGFSFWLCVALFAAVLVLNGLLRGRLIG